MPKAMYLVTASQSESAISWVPTNSDGSNCASSTVHHLGDARSLELAGSPSETHPKRLPAPAKHWGFYRLAFPDVPDSDEGPVVY